MTVRPIPADTYGRGAWRAGLVPPGTDGAPS
jgi:hypothetical protein